MLKFNISPELKAQLISRIKSFAWRLGAYVVVGVCAIILDFFTLSGLDPIIVTIVSLIVGEITKFVNTYWAVK